MKKKINLILSLFLTLTMILGFFGQPVSIQAEGLNVIKQGSVDNFTEQIPIDGLNAFIDISKITNQNAAWQSDIPEIEHVISDGGNQYLAIKKHLGQDEEFSSSGTITISFAQAFINSDGSRSNLILEISDIYIKQCSDNPAVEYYAVIKNFSTLTTTALSADFKRFKNGAAEDDPIFVNAFQRTNRSVKFKIYNENDPTAKFAFGIKDIDVPDATTKDYTGEYLESIEAISGYGPVYIPETSLLNISGNQILSTNGDEDTWNSGFITVFDQSNLSGWKGSGVDTNTKIFESLPFHTVKDSVIGGGEIKYVSPTGEVDQAVVVVGDNANVSIVTRPHEGHKIKKITIDGVDQTPENRLAEFTKEFPNIHEDHEIIAEYEPFTYKINYDANGGQGDMPTDVFTYDDPAFNTKENAFTKEDHKFIGFKLEGRDELITSPEDLRNLLVEKGDGSEITLVAQWEELEYTEYKTEDGVEIAPRDEGMLEPKDFDGYRYVKTNPTEKGQEHIYHKLITSYVDEEGKELLPTKDGTLDPEEIPNYRLVRTEDNENGDREHIYHKLITTFVDEDGKELLPPKDGIHDPETIENYVLVKTNTKENGDVEHVYHKLHTSFVDEAGKTIHPKEDGLKGPEEIPGYKLVETKELPNGDREHIYHQTITRFVDEEGHDIHDEKIGEHGKEDIDGYLFVKTIEEKNGDITHVYQRLIKLDFVVDGKVIKTQKLEKGSSGTAPADPIKQGYSFKGWDTPFTNLQKDTITNAKFEPIVYPVKYVLNGGINNSKNPSSYTIEDVKTILEPTRAGYKFLGWEEGDSIPKGSTGLKTFTAKWKPEKYPINYVLNGGFNNKENPDSYTILDAVDIKEPTRLFHKFVGWKENPHIIKGSTGERTFTAIWDKEVYPIKYVLNDGTNNPNNPTQYASEDGAKIYEPTRQGYRFLGWEEGNEVKAGSTGEKTFTARWEKITSPTPTPTATPTPTPSNKQYTPNTGDAFDVVLWSGVALSAILIALFSIKTLKHNN